MYWNRATIRLAIAAGLTFGAGVQSAQADPIPAGSFSKNLEAVGYTDLDGLRGFKLAIKEHKGKWYLYTGMRTGGWLIIDVTNPRAPKYLKKIAGPLNTNTAQVSLHGNLLITAVQVGINPDWDPSPNNPLSRMTDVTAQHKPYDKSKPYEEGVYLWDIADPVNPKLLSHWMAGSKGTSEQHRASYTGGRYAYLCSEKPGYKGKLLIILDVSNPKKPKEAGVWSNPEQKLPAGSPEMDTNDGCHGPPMMSPDGKMAVEAYTPNLINLDMTDVANPKLIGHLQFIPPFQVTRGKDPHARHLHSALPLWEKGIVVVSSEISNYGCGEEGADFLALVDNKDPQYPKLMSILPHPSPSPEEGIKSYCDKGGFVGWHNLNQETHSPDVLVPNSLIFVTAFNAGLRVFDISQPYNPSEVGYFVPPRPTKRTGWAPSKELVNATDDVLVDRRGYIYISDKQWGIHILRFTGRIPEDEVKELHDLSEEK